MSFWKTSDGQKPEASGSFETGGGDMEPIPNNTPLTAVAIEAKWDEYDGERYINLRWDVVEGEHKNRVIFQKIRVLDSDPKKADKAKRMLAAIDANAGGQLMKIDDAPTDMQLASALCNKPMMITVRVWEIKNEDTGVVEKNGNWVSAVQSSSSKPKPQQQPASQPAKAYDFDDDIPF